MASARARVHAAAAAAVVVVLSIAAPACTNGRDSDSTASATPTPTTGSATMASPCPYDDRKPFKMSRRAPDIHGHCPEPGIHRGAEILRATLPEMWSVIENSQSPATRGLIGYAAGGDLDIPLRFDVAFDGAIDDMKPPTEKGCYHHGDPPYPAASVEDITAQTGDGTGFRKMGDRTAEYRVWQANCPDEMEPQIHQTWLLPDSDIAIYEQRATEFNDAVVQSMQLLR